MPGAARRRPPYLTSPRAVRAPLVVLGEPGSGKSKLAEILAARLAGDDFLPVLVGLRDLAAESMVLEQIEQAIYQRPGERVSWHELLEAAEGALPVVLLDGFDEQIQATSVNRYDYLEQVRDFQKQQAQIGCPVAVIVTSRTVVADQARFPTRSLAMQLQPFTEEQVRRWLEIWDRCNADVLAERDLRPGGAWNETGDRRERRHLKHRAASEVRQVPISPALGRLLRKHIAEHGTAPDGRLFRDESGGLLSDTVYGRIWEKARQSAFTPAEQASPLAVRPYDLRHARLSTWLNTGVAPAQVAEWAGNSVPVLLRVYAKCLTDSEQAALRRLEQAEPATREAQA